MKRYWLKLLASFLLITVLPAGWIVSDLRHAHTDATKAASGVLDLRDWSAGTDGATKLNGEWLLYPGQLLPEGAPEPAAPAATDKQPQLAAVPGNWNGQPGLTSGLGTATYRLRLLLPERTDGVYGIRTSNIRTASRIYVNGEAIGGSGQPGLNKNTTTAGNIPYVGYFKLQGPEAVIDVQVANYSYASGGLIYPLWFGTQEAIAYGREWQLFEYWLTAGGFLIPALFLLLFYRLRRREAPLPQLGGFCVCGLVFALTHGEKAVLALLPVDYELVLRTQLISSGFVYYFLVRYVVLLYPSFGVRAMDRLMLVMALGTGLAGVTLPTVVFSRGEAVLLVCSLVSVAYVLSVLVRAIRSRRAHSLALATTIQSVMCILAVYLLHIFGNLENQAAIPYAILIFSASQAYVIVDRFAGVLGAAEQMSERLLRQDELKDEWMLNTSYEIREPLRGIVNLASQRKQIEGEDAQRLAVIGGIAKRLAYLVDDLVDFSLLKSGDADYRPRVMHLWPAVRAVLELYPSKEPAGWVLEPLSTELPPLLADERRLGQIVHNLIACALRRAGGTTVRLSAYAADGFVTLVVAGPGLGAAMEAGRGETEFYPLDVSAEEADERVRLSVTRQLIELGGGGWKRSLEADGTEALHVAWPQAGELSAAGAGLAETASAASEAASGNAAAGAAATAGSPVDAGEWLPPATGVEQARRSEAGAILLVDDDGLAARAMEHLLGDFGVPVRVAARGQEALRLLEGAPRFDLVIAACIMPDMTGPELTRRIRERSLLSELPVMLLSDGRRPEEALAGIRAGANDLLAKPYDAAELKARVGTLLQLRSSIRSLVRAETAFLQAQIKPHFLFNALNTIKTVCRLDPPRAEELLLELSRYLRAGFDFAGMAERVPVRSELVLVRSYLALEAARFGDRLRAEFDIECDDRLPVPPLSLQPLVENAVRHGIMRKPEGGTIRIGIRATAAGWKVSVEDDGVGMPPDKLATLAEAGGIGLANIRRRLRLLYNVPLIVESKPGQGTRVGFTIPEEAEDESDSDRR
ncbi:MAG: histidine kinase [Paenibacillaceae bacterium]|nr:histidine kinase [Paenibacillaceae bacterium]